jgi:hypothetical protein
VEPLHGAPQPAIELCTARDRDDPPLRKGDAERTDAGAVQPERRAVLRRHSLRDRGIQLTRQSVREQQKAHLRALERDGERECRPQIEAVKDAVFPGSCQHDASV